MNSLAMHAVKQSGLSESHTLGMAEMGFIGLSEQWLMRRAGDLHWRLIATSMGQQSAQFTCPAGEPLYAAFCATSLRLARPELPRLGAQIVLHAALYRAGPGRLASQVRISVNGEYVGRMVLVSAFVGRSDPSSNRSIVRRMPRVLAMPPDADPSIERISREASKLARLASQQLIAVPDDCGANVLPCPSIDFNAAGLLYFPSFSAICDRALFEVERAVQAVGSRHVVYLGNTEPGEAIRVRFRHQSNKVDAVLQGEDERLLALMRVRFVR